MKTAIRLLAVDIDGTLLDSRFELPPQNSKAILAANRQGVEVVLVTGRRYSSARPIASQLPFPLPLIASNGAVIKSSAGNTLDRQLLPEEIARSLLAATRQYREHTALIFDREGRGEIMAEELDLAHPPVQRYVDRNSTFILKVGNLEQSLREDPIQVFFIGATTSMRNLYRSLLGLSCAASVNIARTEYAERDLSLVDVLARDCNKGRALARYAKRQRVEPSQIMALGDNWNDVEMLEFAGLPVIMGNSSRDLKERGWPVTASNDENGVAEAIRRYLLGD